MPPEPLTPETSLKPRQEKEERISFKTAYNYLKSWGRELAPWYYLYWTVVLAGGYITSLYEKRPWQAAPAFLLISVVLGACVLAIWVSLRKLFIASSGDLKISFLIRNRIADDYERGDPALVLIAQFILRAIFVAYTAGFSLSPAFSDNLLSRESILHQGIIIVVTIYFITSAIGLAIGHLQHRILLDTGHRDRVRGILWKPAVLDWWIITLVSIFHSASDYYHLAYIIPSLAAWLFSHSGRAKRLFQMIFVGITIPFLVHLLLPRFLPELAYLFNISPSPIAVSSFLYILLPKWLFWCAVAIPFIVLRQVRDIEVNRRIESDSLRAAAEELSATAEKCRSVAEQHAAEADKNRQMLVTIADNIIYPVFQKNMERKLIYVNNAFADKLGRKKEEIEGKSDRELGIQSTDYDRSDDIVLLVNQPGNQELFQGLEENFDKRAGAPELIFTTKKRLVDPSGRPTGLVGLCEPGTPMHVAQLLESTLENAPYYAILKDRSGHIKWANGRFLMNDVGLSLATIVAMNDRNGANDIDLFGPDVGREYREADARIISAADALLETKRDPLEAQLSFVELHEFRVSKQKRWVYVTKIPWLDGDKSVVKGIRVYYHDFHEFFCLDGMIDRWLTLHLPRTFHGSIRKYRAPVAQDSKGSSAQVPENIRLMLLHLRILGWIKMLVASRPIALLRDDRFALSDLTWIEPILQEIYRSFNLKFSYDFDSSSRIVHGDIDAFAAIILLLVMNAGDATEPKDFKTKLQKLVKSDGTVVGDTRPEIRIFISAQANEMTIRVIDRGRGFLAREFKAINGGNKLNGDNKPGSGLFIVRRLALDLRGSFSVKSDGLEKGATAEFSCPLHSSS